MRAKLFVARAVTLTYRLRLMLLNVCVFLPPMMAVIHF